MRQALNITILAKIKATKDLDAVLPVLVPGQIGIFARQLRQLGVLLPIFGFEFFEDPNEVKSSDGALVGQWYVNNGAATKEFTERYLARFPGGSLFAAGNGNDIVLLLSEAIKRGGTRSKVNGFLHSVKDFSGSLGTYSASGKNTFTLPAVIKVVTPMEFEEIPRGIDKVS